MTVDIGQQPQLTLTAPGRATWTDVPVPVLTGDVDALVRPVAVATCDLDTVINGGRFPLPLPYALGHEFVAEVVAVGDRVTTAQPGDTVAVPFQINCGTCGYCRRGQTGDCATVPHLSAYGLGQIGGDWGAALTELTRVPFADAMLVPLPAGVAPEVVASLDNLTDAYRTVAPYRHDRVLVFGGRSVGLYAVAIARALGADVTYLDRDPRNTAVADALGATVVDHDTTPGDAHPLVVHTSSRPDGLLRAIRATDRGGTLVDTGIYRDDIALPMWRMYAMGITFVTGRANARRDIPAILDLVATGRLDPSVVTATTAGWADAVDAWSGHTDKLVVVR